ncbi:MAG: sensor histidine kinase, partial [Zoogloea sp.]|uniref:sensor histidine kinase n=1 Tax=Zoogloea sp. TaxID=49181 RepID=UPI003F377487
SEQLGSTAAIGALKPVLHTPMGDFDNVGRQVRPDRQLIDGPEFLPGWRPKLEVESAGLIKSFDGERRALLLAVLAGAAVIAFLYFRLSRHLRQRMRHLLRGTQAISAGDWGHRVPEDGEDEIASVSHALNKMSGKLQETLEEAVRMERLAVLGRFATGIAHEIRNPLAALKTTTQALARREADDKRRQLLADMESEIDRLAGVVNDLVDFGRPRDPKPAAVPVREVFRKVFLTTESKAQLRMIHLSCHGDSDLTLWVDHDQLMQIILNLVLNAIEATPAEGAVMLRSCEESGRAHLEVSDTGCGIADEIRERVTEPFFTTKSRGVGLGLSIARQLIELNQGELLIDSRAGRGTSVHVFLPLAP